MSRFDKAPDLNLETVDLQEGRLEKPVQMEAMNASSDGDEGREFPRFTRLEASNGGGNFGSGGPEGPGLFKKAVLALVVLPFALLRAGVGEIKDFLMRLVLKGSLLASKYILPYNTSIKLHTWIIPRFFAAGDWKKSRREFLSRVWSLIVS